MTDAMTRRLAFRRIFVRAGNSRAALRVVERVESAIGQPLHVEAIGPSWKIPEHFELRGHVDLDGTDFGEAVPEALDLLGRVVTSLTDVRVEIRDEYLRAYFAARPESPTGTSVAGLEWFHAELDTGQTATD